MNLCVRILYGVLLTVALFDMATAVVVDTEVIELKIMLQRAKKTYVSDRLDPSTIAQVDTALQICKHAEHSAKPETMKQVVPKIVSLCYVKNAAGPSASPTQAAARPRPIAALPSTLKSVQDTIDKILRSVEGKVKKIKIKHRTPTIPIPIPGFCIVARLLEAFLML